MTLRRVSTGSGSGCDALDAAGVLLRRRDGDDASAHRRLEATRSKLAERRASIRRRSSLLRRAPRRWRSCINLGGCEKDTEHQQQQQHQQRERVRRHSDPCEGGGNRRRGGACVTFSSPLVTDVETRPYTDPDDKDALFYSRSDIALFKARRKRRNRSRDVGGDEDDRDRDVAFADEVVTDVWDPVAEADAGSTTFFEDERAMREGLYYTQEELQGFLQEFLASLEAGTEDDDDDDDEDSECRVGEEPVCAANKETADDDDDEVGACAPSLITDEYDFFDDVPLDGDGGCDCAVPEGIEDSDTDSSDDSDSDSDGSEDDGEDDESVQSGGPAVWPSPPSSTAVPDLQCRRGALAADEPLYAAGRTSNFPDSAARTAAAVTGAAGDDSAADDGWDDVDCDAAPVMGGRLPGPPAVPVLGC